MFGWFKKRLAAWAEDYQQREIARLRKKSMRLKEEIERTTGEPLRLTPEELRQLAKKAKGIDPDRLKHISSLHPDDFTILIAEMVSSEDQ